MSDFRLPEEFLDVVRQYAGQEDSAKMQTAKLLSDFWLEYGEAIEHEGKDRKWYVESVCASVGMSPSSGYNRLRVGDNVIQRGYHLDNENITFGHWLALLRNTEVVEGLVSEDELNTRLSWYYSEMDKHGGQPPSVRDIVKHYKSNGKDPEWKQLWDALVRNARKLLELEDVPKGIRNVTSDFLWQVKEEE